MPRFPLRILLFLLAGLVLSGARAQEPSPAEDRPAPAAGVRVRERLEKLTGLLQAAQAAQALAAADEALTEARNTDDLPGQALAHRTRAQALGLAGRTTEAVAACRAAAAAWKLAHDGAGHVDALGLAALILAVQEAPGVEELLREATERARAETGRPRAAAATLDSLGRYFLEADAPNRARIALAAAVDVFARVAPGTAMEADARLRLGRAFLAQDSLEAAEEQFQQAYTAREKLEPGGVPSAVALGALAEVALARGDSVAARRQLDTALPIAHQKAPGSEVEAATLSLQSRVREGEGDLPGAVLLEEQAYQLRARSDADSLQVAASLARLGHLHRLQGDQWAARTVLLQAIQSFVSDRPGGQEMLEALAELGGALEDAGSLPEAEAALLRTAALAPAGAGSIAGRIEVQRDLARLVRQRADLAGAAERLAQARTLAGRRLPGSRLAAAIERDLGELARLQKDPAAARAHFVRARDLAERLSSGSALAAPALLGLAELERAEGDLPGAERLAADAWTRLREQAPVLLGPEERAGLHAVGATLVDVRAAAGKAAPAFQALEDARARLRLALFEERDLALNAVDETLRNDYRMAVAARDRAVAAVEREVAEAQRARRADAGAKGKPAPAEAPEAASPELRTLQEAAQKARLRADFLWREVRKGSRRAWQPPLDFQTARAALAPGDVFLAFSVGAERTQLFVVRGGPLTRADVPVSVHTAEVSEAELRGLVSEWLQKVRSPGEDPTAAGEALATKLLPAPVRAALLSAKRVIVSPDGPLWDMPFAALPLPAAEGRPGSPYPLSERPVVLAFSFAGYVRGPVSVAPSPAAARPGSGEHETLVHRLGIPNLPLAPAGDGFEAQTRRQLTGPGPVEVSAEGALLADRPMSSGLVLQGGSGESTVEDGALQAWEIFSQLRVGGGPVILPNTTVIGSGGLAPPAMAETLRAAGAGTVFLSRWPGGIHETLTDVLRKHLAAGASPETAMLRAIREAKSVPATAHPSYWARIALFAGAATPPGRSR